MAQVNAQVPPQNVCVSVSKSQGARKSESGVGQGLHGLLLSSVLLIVLFIVCLCWLMVRCYVRREERLPQAQAGLLIPQHSPTDWLRYSHSTQTHTRTHTSEQLVLTSYRLCTCLQMPTVRSSPSASTGPLFGLSATVWCVRVARVAILCSHWAAIIAGVCLACAPRVGFIPLHQAGGVYWNSFPPS